MWCGKRLRSVVFAVVVGFGLILQPAPEVAAQDKGAATASAADEAQPAADGVWPREYPTGSGARLTVYQPQVAEWPGQKHMVAYAAVSYDAGDSTQPALGSLKVEADTRVSLEKRLVDFSPLKISEFSFPTLSKEQAQDALTAIENGIPDEERVIALDRVLTNMDKSQIIPKDVKGVKSDPPQIYYSEKPAILVAFDGEPIWGGIQSNDLKYAINTNWDVFQHGPTSTYFLRNDAAWLQSSAVEGPWVAATTLPESFSKLPASDDWKEVKAALPPKRASQTPTVFTSNKPAELILMKGSPYYVPIEGTGLFWVSNTESDVFRVGKGGTIYFLVAGRWFSASSFSGPWTFATPTLPEDFGKIPLEHPRSRVLASVPGTEQAAEAILLAQVPQTARVNIKQVKAPDVAYRGEPEFQPIEETSLARAVNTDKDIIKVGDAYYMCYQGVWFTASSPEGPWTAATTVPGEIYEIPPSSPVYPVTYVTVEDSDTSDEWATYAYTAGYLGMMTAYGTLVYGSGYYYPPYYWYDAYLPIYYPYPYTYGFGAWYNPLNGVFGRGAAAYGPYGGIGAGAVYRPETGTYARGAVAYGPYGAAGAAQAWNPRTGTYGATKQGANIYGSWGSTYVQRGDDWASTKRYTNRATGDTTRMTRTDSGAALTHRGGPGDSGFVAAGEGGNVYAGHDGNIYRQQGGTWQKWDNGGWTSAGTPTPVSARQPGAIAQQLPAAGQLQNRAAQGPIANQPRTVQSPTGASLANRPVQRPAAVAPAQQVNPAVIAQLNRDMAARQLGAQRAQAAANYQRQMAARNVGSYAPARGPVAAGGARGGGMRGGGGRGGGGRR